MTSPGEGRGGERGLRRESRRVRVEGLAWAQRVLGWALLQTTPSAPPSPAAPGSCLHCALPPLLAYSTAAASPWTRPPFPTRLLHQLQRPLLGRQGGVHLQEPLQAGQRVVRVRLIALGQQRHAGRWHVRRVQRPALAAWRGGVRGDAAGRGWWGRVGWGGKAAAVRGRNAVRTRLHRCSSAGREASAPPGAARPQPRVQLA
jgi:hypothetical protein